MRQRLSDTSRDSQRGPAQLAPDQEGTLVGAMEPSVPSSAFLFHGRNKYCHDGGIAVAR